MEEDHFATYINFDGNTLDMSHINQDIIDNYDFSQHGPIRTLCISGDYLQRLHIPEGVRFAYIGRLGLRELYVPDSIEYLVCDNNFLPHLDLPAGIDVVEANNNLITKVTFRGEPTNLSVLELRANRLLSLDFPVTDNLHKVLIDDNPYLRESRLCPQVRKFTRMQVVMPPSFLE